MKVRYRKGIANHPGPESCGGAREGAAEALTGEAAGQSLSRVISNLERRRRRAVRKATLLGALARVPGGLHAVIEPEHAEKLFAQKLGALVSAR
jgi:hypothetical protein